jgi:Cytochrome b5-like Heme/Steroid binding domain
MCGQGEATGAAVSVRGNLANLACGSSESSDVAGPNEEPMTMHGIVSTASWDDRIQEKSGLSSTKISWALLSSLSLSLLTSIWFALCALLVWKHPELLVVFWVFVLCWAASWCSASFCQQTLTARPSIATCRRIRQLVGVTSCCLAFWILSNHENKVSYLSVQLSPSKKDGSAPPADLFWAYSVMAGYLAYDPWYSVLFCEPPPSKQIGRVVEDALTLTAVCFILVSFLLRSGTREEESTCRTLLTTWLVYKIGRLTLDGNAIATVAVEPAVLASLPPRTGDNSRQQWYHAIPGVSFTLKLMFRLVHGADPAWVPKAPVPPVGEHLSPQYWYIHGQPYDLSSYVQKHPGGAEAILLGQSRDCTALFESYHPFSLQLVRPILEKYRVVEEKDCATAALSSSPKSVVQAPLAEPQPDFFMEILRERVEKTLREHHLDPIRDRCATWKRVGYYLAVIVLVIYSGFMHVKVRIPS